MVAVDVGARNGPNVAAADDLDDLLDYDVGDVFRDVDINIDAVPQQNKSAGADGKGNSGGLGIDEEIKVVKKRAPVPKLDEDRLLGSAGIPKLRRTTKEHLKFKGNGHEYSDVARLLNVYQLWLDDLYPRAKFADGLAIIEKLGHSKRMQTMRREWINEGKPKEHLQTLEESSQTLGAKRLVSQLRKEEKTAMLPTKGLQPPAIPDDEEEELYAATPKRGGKEAVLENTNLATQSLFFSDSEEVNELPSEDDLEALLAENQAKPNQKYRDFSSEHPRSCMKEQNFDDEMEVMAGMDYMW